MEVSVAGAIDIIVENKEEFLSIFPEIKKPLQLLLGSKDQPGCKACQRKKYERDIMTVIMLLDKEDRDITRLLIHQDPQLMGALTYEPKPGDPRPAPDGSMPALPPTTRKEPTNAIKMGEAIIDREGCADCVCKHLSQALILTDEITQGYPEHVKLALKHTEHAINYVAGRNIKKRKTLEELANTFKSIIKEEDTEQSTEFFLQRAREIIKQMLEDDMAHPLAVWRVIGHMGEAADECVQDNPVLAGQIREERLALMEDHMYRPTLAKLLNDARKTRL